MSDAQEPQIDRRKIRIGLALIVLVVIAAVILMFVVEAPAGKAVMFAIAVTAFVRALLLSRSLRREQHGR
jgi:heme A synthase